MYESFFLIIMFKMCHFKKISNKDKLSSVLLANCRTSDIIGELEDNTLFINYMKVIMFGMVVCILSMQKHALMQDRKGICQNAFNSICKHTLLMQFVNVLTIVLHYVCFFSIPCMSLINKTNFTLEF